MSGRVASAAALVVGLALIIMTLALSLFGRAAAGERITDSFRSTVAARGFTQLGGNYKELRAFGTQFVGQTVPDLTRDLGVTPAQFRAKLNRDFPATARAVRDVPPAIALVDPVIPQLVAVRPDFHKVDRIPGLGLPITAVPWALMLLGAALIGLGAVGLAGRRAALIGIAVTGVGMVIVPFVLGMPGKLAAGPHLLDAGKSSLSQRAADTANRTVQDVDAMVPEVQYSLIPALAARFHQTPLAFRRTLASRYPAVIRQLDDWPRQREAAVALVTAQAARVGDQKRLEGTPFRALTWFVVVPGALLALAAGLALRPRRKPAGDHAAALEVQMRQ